MRLSRTIMELTLKEKTILKHVCEDYNNAEIAAKMGYNLRYFEKLKSALYKKTKVESNVGLLKWAVVNELYVIKKRAAAKTKRKTVRR